MLSRLQISLVQPANEIQSFTIATIDGYGQESTYGRRGDRTSGGEVGFSAPIVANWVIWRKGVGTRTLACNQLFFLSLREEM